MQRDLCVLNALPSIYHDRILQMTDITRIGAGSRMSQAVSFGNLTFIAGQVAAQTKAQSVQKQTEEVLSKIDQLLAEAGTSKARILSASIWLSDISTFAQMNETWNAWVDSGVLPARACVEARLAHPSYAVEIAVVAAS